MGSTLLTLLTTALLYNAMRDVWRWSLAAAIAVSGGFLLVDLAFFAANMLKLPEGGWIPLLLGAILFIIMTSWRKGVDAVRQKLADLGETTDVFRGRLLAEQVPRVPGTAVFLSRGGLVISPVLVRHVKQMKALQSTVVSLTIDFAEVPRIDPSQRAEVEDLGNGLWHVTVRFGFVEKPNVAEALAAAHAKGCPLNLDDAVYFASHDEVIRSETKPRLAGWRRVLFAVMYRNAVRAPDRFDLPADQFLEVGRQIAL